MEHADGPDTDYGSRPDLTHMKIKNPGQIRRKNPFVTMNCQGMYISPNLRMQTAALSRDPRSNSRHAQSPPAIQTATAAIVRGSTTNTGMGVILKPVARVLAAGHERRHQAARAPRNSVIA